MRAADYLRKSPPLNTTPSVEKLPTRRPNKTSFFDALTQRNARPQPGQERRGRARGSMPTPQTSQGLRGVKTQLEWHSDGSESGSVSSRGASISSTPSTPRTVIHADPSFVVYTYAVPLPRFEPPPRPGSMAVRKRVSQADAHLRAGVRQAKADACYGQAQALKSSKTYAHVSSTAARAP